MTQQRYNANDLCKLPIVKQTSFASNAARPNQTLPMLGAGSQSAEAVPSRELACPSEDEGGIEAYKLGDLVDARYLLVGDLVSLTIH